MRARSPHAYSNGFNNFAYGQSFLTQEDPYGGFPPDIVQYTYNQTMYPSEVHLDESSTTTASYTLDTDCLNDPVEASIGFSSVSEPGINWYEAFFEGDVSSEVTAKFVRDGDDARLPSSPTTQRYITEEATEERIRLGLPRFQSAQKLEAHYSQSTRRR